MPDLTQTDGFVVVDPKWYTDPALAGETFNVCAGQRVYEDYATALGVAQAASPELSQGGAVLQVSLPHQWSYDTAPVDSSSYYLVTSGLSGAKIQAEIDRFA